MAEFEDWRLCLVRQPWAYFCPEDPQRITGDDWDDSPAYCNAGPPNSVSFKVAYEGAYEENTNTMYSAKEINAHPLPWLRSWRDLPPIWPGTTLKDFVKMITKADGNVYLPFEVRSRIS